MRQLLQEQGGGVRRGRAAVSLAQVAALIDHTLLKPEATQADIQKLCDEARRHGFFSVCVNPTYVRQAGSLLRGTPVKVCCVVGFPLGAQPPETKALEARQGDPRRAPARSTWSSTSARSRAREDAMVLKDIRAVVEACKDGRAICKVILETALLTDEEKVRGCELSMKAGAEYVKTSTGFGPGGATAADVALMSRTVAPKKLGVKAAGGIRSYADLVQDDRGRRHAGRQQQQRQDSRRGARGGREVGQASPPAGE